MNGKKKLNQGISKREIILPPHYLHNLKGTLIPHCQHCQIITVGNNRRESEAAGLIWALLVVNYISLMKGKTHPAKQNQQIVMKKTSVEYLVKVSSFSASK